MGPRMIWGKRNALVAESRRRRHTAENGTVKPTTPGWYRVCSVCPLIVRAVPALLGIVSFVPSYAVAAENEDMATLRRMIGELGGEPQTFRTSRCTGRRGAAA